MHPRVKRYKGSPDQLMRQAYTCVLQNQSNQGCIQGSKCYKGPVDQVLLQAHTCVLQNTQTQGFAQGSTVTKVWPTTGCCCCRTHQRRVWPTKLCKEHTHVCCRTDEFRVPAKGQTQGQRLQRFGRPVFAVSTHVYFRLRQAQAVLV